MNKFILNTVNQTFINNNLDSDIAKLLFQNKSFENTNIKEIVGQIGAKKKCKTKLFTWFNTPNIYYPNKLNVEQTSSELTAEYKSKIVSGDSLIDLTGGFGVDSYYFAQQMKHVTHCEIDHNLSKIAKHNFQQLGVSNVSCYAANGINFLKNATKTYDWVYVDPSRRHNIKGKVYFLKDCLPNIPDHLNDLFKYSSNILIKTSPLLDITAGIKELSDVKTVHIIAVNNDVKELLWVLEKGFNGEITVKTTNLNKEGDERFMFPINAETTAHAQFSEPLTYLYEPNAAILKSGAFKLVSEQLNVKKLNVNTHLYTSKDLIDFPGRSFKIDKIIPYNKKLLKKEFLYNKANISSRNFPESVEALKKKFHIKDGGTSYIFFTTDFNNQKIVLICTKALLQLH